MADIQQELSSIATAFYGAQVRTAIVAGLQSINDEVNTFSNNFNQTIQNTQTALQKANASEAATQTALDSLTSAQNSYTNLSQSVSSLLSQLQTKEFTNVTLEGATNITGGTVVQENGGSINYNNSSGTNVITEGVSGSTFALTNSQTNNNIFSVTPVSSGTDTLTVNSNISLEQIVTCIGANAGFNLQTADGKYTISASPTGAGDRFYICDNTNGNTIALYNPATKALTLYNTTLNDAVTLNNVLTCQGGQAGINFETTDGKYTLGLGADGNNDEFIIMDNTNGNIFWKYNPINQVFTLTNATLNNPNVTNNMAVNASLVIQNQSGEIFFQNAQNQNMISIGTLNDQFVLSNTITGNPLFSLTPVSSGIDNVNVESNVTFMQPIDLESGLQAQGQDVVTVFPAIQGTTYVTGSAEVSYYAQMWALEGGLLTVGNQNDIKLGILRVVVTPSTSFTWDNGQTITINCSEIPNLHGAPLQVATVDAGNWWDADPFVCSVNEGNLLLTGSPNSWNLNAGQNYTNYALVFIETT